MNENTVFWIPGEKNMGALTVCSPRLCGQASILSLEENGAAMKITAEPHLSN